MFLKDELKPGQYVMPVPLGLPAVLQYDENGVIQKVYKRFGDDSVNVSSELFDTLYNSKLIPDTIPIKTGTTYVSGVFCCNTVFTDDGELPLSIEHSIIQQIINEPNTVKFYAGHVHSLAVTFNGAVPVRQWLQMSKFLVLPGYLMPANITRDSMMNTFCKGSYPFNSPLISHYMIYDNASFRIVSTGISGHVIKASPSKFLNSVGYIKSEINGDQWKLITDYSNVVHFRLSKGTYVVQDKYGKIIYSLSNNVDFKNTIECSICGKLIKVPFSGEVCCNDDNCLSRLYPNVSHFLASLHLPMLPYDNYINYVEKHEITTFSDIMLLPEYKDMKLVVSPAELLKAIIPLDAVRDRHVIEIFVNSCNQSKSVIHHYMNHPDNIIADLHMLDNYNVGQLVDWFRDIEHVSTVDTLMYSENIEVTDTFKKFEGAPIFRGKSIVVTGSFHHGSLSEVSSILCSYSADVTLNLTEKTNLVLVGGLRENTNGSLINTARQLGIPVMEESQFFNQYEIDKDLSENLL